LWPGDELRFGGGGAEGGADAPPPSASSEVFRVKLQHESVPLTGLHGGRYSLLPCSQLERMAAAAAADKKGAPVAV
jgi:hypothetical protein